MDIAAGSATEEDAGDEPEGGEEEDIDRQRGGQGEQPEAEDGEHEDAASADLVRQGADGESTDRQADQTDGGEHGGR